MPESTTLIFSVQEGIGTLAEALDVFKQHEISLSFIESRVSRSIKDRCEFLISFQNTNGHVRSVIEQLKSKGESDVRIIPSDQKSKDAIPWFPRKMKDLDEFADKILTCASELSADHPGFTDELYKERRQELADIAYNYRHGQELPSVSYTEEEKQTWNTVYTQLVDLYPTHACQEYNRVFPLLQEHCGYRADNIPQLIDVSRFLQGTTGFRLRPVAGLLTSRDFLAGLAFRVFHATQYVRHESRPDYTPEPDVCHELLGHAPLFADPAFAQFSQEIGLASLGAPDEWIEKLATCYWFTLEFGLCSQGGQIKAYGASLLSSYGELQYCLRGKSEIRDFEPAKTGVQKYPISEYQPVYFVSESFESAQRKMKEMCKQIPRPFAVRYNPYTESVEVIDNKEKLLRMSFEMQSDCSVIHEAMEKVF